MPYGQRVCAVGDHHRFSPTSARQQVCPEHAAQRTSSKQTIPQQRTAHHSAQVSQKQAVENRRRACRAVAQVLEPTNVGGLAKALENGKVSESSLKRRMKQHTDREWEAAYAEVYGGSESSITGPALQDTPDEAMLQIIFTNPTDFNSQRSGYTVAHPSNISFHSDRPNQMTYQGEHFARIAEQVGSKAANAWLDYEMKNGKKSGTKESATQFIALVQQQGESKAIRHLHTAL